MKKLFLALTLVAVVSSLSFGQKIGIKVGGSMAGTSIKDENGDKVEDLKSKIGLQLGVIADLPLGDNVQLNTGLLFSQKGNKMEEQGITFTNNVNYVEIPIALAFLFGPDIFVEVGPYAGFALSGKAKLEGGGQSFEEDLSIGNSDEDDIKGMDYGVTVGGGIYVSKIKVSLNYNLGLANLIPGETTGDESIKNGVLTLGVAYLLVNN